MGLKANGLNTKSDTNNLYCVLGFTDEETVKVDFDDTPFKTVKYWALRMMKFFRLEGFVVLRSSENNYHVVFDRKVSWKRNSKIMAWVCLFNLKNVKLTKWFLLQCIKGGSTLRVSHKRKKPCPRVVFRYGQQGQQIKVFEDYRKLIKNIVSRLQVDMLD